MSESQTIGELVTATGVLNNSHVLKLQLVSGVMPEESTFCIATLGP